MPRHKSDLTTGYAHGIDPEVNGDSAASAPEEIVPKADQNARERAQNRLDALMKRASHKKIMQILAE